MSQRKAKQRRAQYRALRVPEAPWQPLVPAQRHIGSKLREAAKTDPRLQAVIDDDANKETWINDTYVVHVYREPAEGWVTRLSIRRQDNQPGCDWPDFQRIKNQLAGPEAWGIDIYPAESQLVDTANQYWIWMLPPGVEVPFGFHDGRLVMSAAEAARYGATQRDPKGGESNAT